MPPMETVNFIGALSRLKITQEHLRRLLDCDKNTISRWATGQGKVPVPVAYLLTACLEGKLTISDLERMHLDRLHG